MDISRNLCLINKLINFNKYEKHTYKSNKIGSPRSIRKNSISTIQKDIIQDNKITNYVENLNIADPYLSIDSKFSQRSSIILSNIDAVFNITNQIGGYLLPQNMKEYNYGVLEDSDAGYIEYLQYRLPISKGFTYCNNSLNRTEINENTLNVFTHSLKNKNNYDKYVNSIIPDGLDLLISNKSIKRSLLVGLKTIKYGGNLVIRIDDKQLKNNIKLLNLIYITSMNFEKINIFKPISENINNNWSYLIAQNYYNQSTYWIEIIQKETDINLPQNFLTYIKEFNTSLNCLRNKLSKIKSDDIYNIYKCISIWNII